METYQLDTNFILEFLLKNHSERAPQLKAFFKEIKSGKKTAILSEPVFLEMTVVLQNYYKLSRLEITKLLERILAQDWLKIENIDWVTSAAKLFAEHSLDMTDCLLLARTQKYRHKIATFDGKLNTFV